MDEVERTLAVLSEDKVLLRSVLAQALEHMEEMDWLYSGLSPEARVRLIAEQA